MKMFDATGSLCFPKQPVMFDPQFHLTFLSKYLSQVTNLTVAALTCNIDTGRQISQCRESPNTFTAEQRVKIKRNCCGGLLSAETSQMWLLM